MAETEANKRWRAANKVQLAAYHRAWHANHKEQRKAARKKWRIKYPEKVRANFARWKALNPDKVKLARRKYMKAHPVPIKFTFVHFCRHFLRNFRSWDRVKLQKQVRHLCMVGKQAGFLTPPAVCERCGADGAFTKLCIHHEDYHLPLTINWYCRACHNIMDKLRRERLGETAKFYSRHRTFTEAERDEMKALFATGMNQCQIARKFCCSNCTVSRIVNDKPLKKEM